MKVAFLLVIIVIYSISDDAHAQWIETSAPDGMDAFAANGTTLFAGNDTGLFASSDFGTTWSEIGFDSDWVQALVVRNNTVFTSTQAHGIFTSTDNGVSWTQDTAGLSGVFDVTGMVASDSNLIISTNKGVFYSTDNGGNWQSTPIKIQTLRVASSGFNAYAVESVVTKNSGGIHDTCYAWYSSDAGLTWTEKGALQQNTQIYFCYSLVCFDSLLMSGSGNGSGIIVSTDRGATWSSANNGLYAFPDTEIIPRFNIHYLTTYGNSVFMATNYGLFITTNMGSKWENITNDTLMYDDDSQIFNADGLYAWDGRLWAGADDAVWFRPLYQIFHEGSVPEPLDEKYLLSIFPNPAREETTVAVNVSQNGPVVISIVNALGVTVTTIFNGELSSGEHSFRWNSNRFISGTYECIVRANNMITEHPVLIEH